jgi:hypothetical protein
VVLCQAVRVGSCSGCRVILQPCHAAARGVENRSPLCDDVGRGWGQAETPVMMLDPIRCASGLMERAPARMGSAHRRSEARCRLRIASARCCCLNTPPPYQLPRACIPQTAPRLPPTYPTPRATLPYVPTRRPWRTGHREQAATFHLPPSARIRRDSC